MAKKIVVPDRPSTDKALDIVLLGNVSRFVRTSLNLTIEDAAALCGVSKQSLNDIELAKSGCRLSTVMKVTKGLGIKLHISIPENLNGSAGDNNDW